MKEPGRRAAFWEGVKVVWPILIGIFPYGMIIGSIAVASGLTAAQAICMAVGIYAGASQLVALQLYQGRASLFIIVSAVTLVNLRLLMYSAALAPQLRRLSHAGKLLAGYLLTDEAFSYTALNIRQKRNQTDQAWFYLGTAIPIWIAWQLGTIVGVNTDIASSAVFNTGLFGLVVPVVFLTMLLPELTDLATMATTISSAVIVTLVIGLPYGLELIIAVVGGIITGLIAESLTT